MKTPRPIGRIRLIAPIIGRARRRWRGGPLAPMIWRRRRPAPPAAPQKRAAPHSVTHSHAFNLTLVWPAGIAARAGPLRREAATPGERVRAAMQPGRLVTSVERLWQRSGEPGPRSAAGPLPSNAPWMALRHRPARERPDGPEASTSHEDRPAPGAATVSRGVEASAANLRRLGAPRGGRPRPMRAGAIRLWTAPLEAATRTSPPPARMGAPSVWSKSETGGEGPFAPHRQAAAHRTTGVERVWRRPPAGSARDTVGAVHELAASASGRSDSYARADRPSVPAQAAPVHAAPAAPAPAAIPPAEMSRLVDEVVRRLDRIGRDERMRRGI